MQFSQNREQLFIFPFIRARSPDDAVGAFVSFLSRKMGRNDVDGIVLVFAHEEVLQYFLRCVALSEGGRDLREGLSCVKGYLVLEVSFHKLRRGS